MFFFSQQETTSDQEGRNSRKEDTDNSEYGCEEEEVVRENWSKIEPLVAGSWRHDWIGQG